MEDTAADFAVGASIGLFGWFFGGLDGFFKVLLTFAIIDYFSGLSVAAWVKHNISSTIGFKGITKKCLMFSFVGIAHILDKYLLGGTRALRTAVCLFYIGNEGISIIENADLLGVPFPKTMTSSEASQFQMVSFPSPVPKRKRSLANAPPSMMSAAAPPP